MQAMHCMALLDRADEFADPADLFAERSAAMMPGLWQLARWKGVPILFHWSVLLGVLWFALLYRSIVPALLTFAGFFALLLIHEMGHAAAAWSRGLRVHEIRLYLLHGLCEHASPRRERDHVFIAWGGVLAQGFVLVLAVATAWALGKIAPGIRFTLEPLFRVLTIGNMVMIAINLIPVAPLDGHIAWRVLKPLRGALAARAHGFSPMKRLRDMRRRRAMKRDAENKVVDLLERMKDRKR